MRPIVLDASVAVKWYVHEHDRELALGLLEAESLLFIAPDILLPEVVNALLRQNRAGKFADELLDLALADLDLTCPELVPSKALIKVATEVARTLGHPIYDCLYLALAQRWDTVLVTADEDFVSLCRRRLADESLVARLKSLREYRVS